ncbi:TOBE domain-containing protein [Mailhella sp.]|uniref:TOBE domain-containing protein n=1 Tax=Mailhella sp. TaxID=1981029 RepID=UPI003AB8239A
MKVTTRNMLEGVVTAVKKGAVNDEIDIDLKGGLKISAIVTCKSTETLGLRPGREVLAMVKGINVLLVRDLEGYVLSSRNMLPGTVKQVKKGEIMASVSVELDNGDRLTSVCTVDSADEAGIAEGVRVQAAIKAPHVVLAAKQ